LLAKWIAIEKYLSARSFIIHRVPAACLRAVLKNTACDAWVFDWTGAGIPDKTENLGGLFLFL